MAAHLVWKPSKRKQEDVAHIRFVFQGRKFFRSLKTTDETTANNVLWRASETLRRIQQGELELPQDCTFDQAYSFIVSGGKPPAATKVTEPATLENIKDDYFSELPDGAKEISSLRTEKTHTKHLVQLLGKNTPLRNVDVAKLQRYVAGRLKEDGRRGKKVQPDTIKKELQTFKQLWDFARARNHVDGECPKQHVKLPKPDEKPPFRTWGQIEAAIKQVNPTEEEQVEFWDSLFLREKEILKLLEYVQEAAELPFIYPMIAFAAFTGARRSEILRSEVGDFQFEDGWVLVREKKRQKTVSISYRRVQLHDKLREIMSNWFENHPGGAYTLCCPPNLAKSKNKSNSPQPLTTNQANDHFKRTLADSKWKVLKGFHALRHSFASICAMKGIQQSIIDQWLGHQTEEMRNRYRHLFPEETKKAMDSLLASDISTLFGR